MGKVTFWGYQNPVQHKYAIMQKYKYVKHRVGPNKREVYVKFPNIYSMRKIIEARKLLHMKFVFGGISKTVASFKSWADWCENFRGLNNGEMKMKYRRDRRLRSTKTERIKPKAQNRTENEGNYKRQAVVADSHIGSFASSSGNADDGVIELETFPISQVPQQEDMVFSDKYRSPCSSSESGSHHKDDPIYIPLDSWVPLVQKVTSTRGSRRYTNIRFRVGVKRKADAASGNVDVQQEEWQCQRFKVQMEKVLGSTEVREVVTNNTLVALGSTDAGVFHTANTVLMKTMQAAVYAHDWALASKSVEGLAREITKTTKHWMLWNGGFLALINIYRNDISHIVEFASYVQEVMGLYPPRLKVEVGTWLTQRGYFANAAFLMQIDERSWWNLPNFQNPRRLGIDLIVAVFNAVDQYSCYKRDVARHPYGSEYPYEEEHEALCRNGEYALSLFENLLDMCDSVENDGTIFIEPFIELLLEFRTKFRAKSVFEELCRKHLGNGVLEELYLQFLQRHFPDSKDEIEPLERKLNKYDFSIPREVKLVYDQKFRRFVQSKITKGKGTPLQPIPKPTFSW